MGIEQELPSDWTAQTIEECMSAIIDYRGKTPQKTSFGVPLITAKIVKGGRILEAEEFIAESDYEAWMRRGMPLPGDVVVTTEAPLGEVAQLDGRKIALAQRLIGLRGKPDRLDNTFLRFAMQAAIVQDQLASRASGTTVLGIRQAELRHVEIPLPPLPEQRAIARVLGGLDDKIELNRRMNRTLEELARGVFRSWFVDFDPVLRPARARPHAPPDAAPTPPPPRFPTRLVDSPLGPIPEGWRVATVADLARYVNGRNFTKDATGTGRMVVRIAELNSGPGGSTVYNDVKAEPENVVHPGELLFAWSGSLDVYRWHRDEALVNQHIFKVVCEAYPQWFVHFHLREAMPFFQGIAADKATTMGHIKREHLKQAELALPPDSVLKYASEQIEPIYARMLANERDSLRLAATRDALLPVLLSGEVRLRNEREAERAVDDSLQTTSPPPRASGNGSPRGGKVAGTVKGRA